MMPIRHLAWTLLLVASVTACGGYGDGEDYAPTGPTDGNPPTGTTDSDEDSPTPPPSDPY